MIQGLDDAFLGARADAQERNVVRGACAGAFRPEIVTINLPMSIPEGLVMGVIMLFTSSLSHGPIASHWESLGPHNGVKEGTRNVLIVIFGEKFPVNFDA